MAGPAMRMTPPWTPELMPVIQHHVERLLAPQPNRPKRVLELGSGWSTLWFASMGCELLSLEHDEGWHAEVRRALTAEGFPCSASPISTSLCEPTEMVTWLGRCFTEYFNLALVDCVDEQRLPCLELVRDKVRPGGVVVMDDSHWGILKPAWTLFGGWEPVTVSGSHHRKDGSVQFHQTTFFTKSL